MSFRYVIEILDAPAEECCFSYIDTEDNLADFVFDRQKVRVTTDMEIQYDDPFKVKVCRIPRKQRKAFLRAIDMLPGFMAYAGRKDYDEYCRGFFENARMYMMNAGTGGGSIPIQ